VHPFIEVELASGDHVSGEDYGDWTGRSIWSAGTIPTTRYTASSQPSARGHDDGHSRVSDHSAVAESLLKLEETG
jgi:hypothetical protein